MRNGTITFNTCGGTEIPSITQDYGTAIIAPADPTKEGYTFVGWEPELPTTMPAGNLELKAKWKINQYTITFNTEGGSEVASITQDYGTAITAPEAPTKEGYTFVGWEPELPATMPAGNLELKAKWEVKQYTLTWVVDGQETKVTYNFGEEITPLVAPEKTGYTFTGWDKEIPTTMPAEDVTITATWTINKYTITFNTDGGSSIAPITVDYDAAITAPADPTKEGYTFVGWEPELPATMPAGNLELKAKWEVKQYTLTWVVDGQETKVTYNFGEEITPLVAPEKTGYTFTGWDKEIPTTMPAEDVTITATWTINKYTITFNTEGGSEVASITQDYGTAITAPEAPTKEGYTFVGWEPELPTTMPAGNLELKAKWKINQYTITFNTEGGSEVASITQDYGTAITAPEAPTKEGYTFVGWEPELPATMPAGNLELKAKWEVKQYTLTWVVDGQETKVTYNFGEEITPLVAPEKTGYTFTGWDKEIPTTMPAEDVTITATWTINKYTITFNTDGGSSIAPITVDYDAAITAPEAPTKEGYTFVGWEPELPATMPAGNLELKAKWEVKQYTLTWVVDGQETKVTYNFGEEITPLVAPEKTGYTFTGWDKEIPTTMPAEDVTITATWTINKYTITFNTEGGSEVASITQDYGTAITAPEAPTKEGYTFVGWEPELPATMPAGNLELKAKWEVKQYTLTWVVDGQETKVTYNFGEEITPLVAPEKTGYTFTGWDREIPTTMPAEDVTITATWTINKYTITFNTDGGSSIAPITADYGTEVTAPAEPTKTGYTFAGWDNDIPTTMPAEDVTITAKWTINQYTITFNTDGGSSIAPITVDYGAAIIAPADPTKEGYTFVGWEPALPTTMPAEDVTITAKWTINQYTITFNTDGGSSIAPITVDYGAAIIAPADPTKEGYTFVGWEPALPTTMPAEDVTITAKWTINQYTITFNTDGGSSIAPITVDYGAAIIAPAEPTKTGYTFAGWDKEIPTTMPAENVTITAKWTINQYTITFDTDGGSGIDPITADYGTEVTAPANPTKMGYTFTGWDPEIPTTMPAENVTITAQWTINQYTITFDTDGGSGIGPITADYGTEVTAPANPTKTGYTFTGWDPEIPTTMPAENVTIIAQWTINQYTITFDTDGGSGIGPITADYGTEVTAPADPTKTGYTFAGWDPEIPTTMPAEDVTITAKWTINQYTITFDTDGGSGIDPITADYGTEVTAPADPTKTGYTFAGWDPEIPTTMPAEDVTITAKWTINQYTITFDTDGGSGIDPITADYGTEVTAPANPTKTGYTFAGWDKEIPTTMPAEDVTITAKWTINQYTITFDTDGGSGIDPITADYGTTITAPADPTKEGYTFAGWDKEIPTTMPAEDVTITAQWAVVIVIGDESTDGELNIVNRDYIDNSVISDDIGPVAINIGNEDVTDSFDFTFYDQEGGTEITMFDLSEGATTFRVFMEATSEEYKNISTYVVFKYRSVTIGDNDDYYTIEDALTKADSGDMVYVKYNTSFADTDIAEEVYNSTDFTVKSGVTLLLPYSSDLSSSTNDTPSGTGGALTRNKAYVELTLPAGIELNVEGTLTVNAMRASYSTRYCGHVTGANYAQLHIKEAGSVTVKSGGTLNCIGFIYGEGTVEALSGSSVHETMFVRSFRGGTATFAVQSKVFPFDQFTVNNIEVEMTVNRGASYTAGALLYASSSYVSGTVKLAGTQSDCLLQIEEGKIIKTYDPATGRVSFEIQGKAKINDTTVQAGGITASSSGKDMPFDGTWRICVAEGSTITINSWVMLLPGARVDVEPGATVTVVDDARVTVFDPYEHIDTYNTYPTSAAAYYRTAPSFDYDSETPATLNVDGTLVVEGSLAGRVHKGATGSIDLLESASTTYDVKYVHGSARDATVYSRNVRLLEVGESPTIHTSQNSANSGAEIAVVATVTDADGNPLEGKEVEFSGGAGNWSATTGTTDSKGKVRVTYTIGDNDSDTITLSVKELNNNKTDSVALEISTGGGSTCLADGTLITLADGSQKPVEELTGDELLLVWNLHTGTFDIAPITFIDSDPLAEYEIIHLHFSDGTDVKVIYEHGFWDFNLNEYVLINGDNPQQYIGHWFKKQITDADGNLTWTKVQLVDVVFEYEFTRAWSPVSHEHLSYYTNGMLSIPGGIEGLINIFEVSPDTLKIDEDAYLADIAEYGLFTYEEFTQIINVPAEMFDAFQAKYFKVAIGKGHITVEDLLALILHYGDLLGLDDH